MTPASFFPAEEADLLGMAAQAAASRCWAGIHFPNDDDIGLTIGHTIGYLVAELINPTGASSTA